MEKLRSCHKLPRSRKVNDYNNDGQTSTANSKKPAMQQNARPRREEVRYEAHDGPSRVPSRLPSFAAKSGPLTPNGPSQVSSGSLTSKSTVASGNSGSLTSKTGSQGNSGSLSRRPSENKNETSVAGGGDTKMMTIIVERPGKSQHQRRATVDLSIKKPMTRIVSLPRGKQGEQVVAGWPSWLTSVAGEAIQGWLPRRADSFERLDKIGQGTYSSVYKARDLETGKIVAMKKVRFVNMEPESVRFMAREILILRKLDHPNVMKLEGLVTSRMSGSLYLVFEYMEHDLAGLVGTPGNKFTEPQLLRGLEHCHSRGVLHRDIKGSNLLINNDGVLKIGDFGLATFFKPDQNQPLTSRVVTLWYRAPELLLGSTDYGIAVDMWSVGCILAELFAGKPIMPGRTEVEQMHKIFKLCGSPSDDYWKNSKLPHATSFKPTRPYKRRLTETFKEFPSSALALVDVLLAVETENRGTASSALKSEFFSTTPLPCDPSSLPKYTPTKELDVKFREEERRRKAEEVKGQAVEPVKAIRESSIVGFEGINGLKTSLKGTMVNPNVSGSSSSSNQPNGNNLYVSSRNSVTELNLRAHTRKDDSATVYLPKKNRMHYSGPLMPPGGNMEEMLKEHERQIQQAVRKSRASRTSNNGQRQSQNHNARNLRLISEFQSLEERQ
ncbi:hypothetical protein V2J09_023259 [Rumex salicifolius]